MSISSVIARQGRRVRLLSVRPQGFDERGNAIEEEEGGGQDIIATIQPASGRDLEDMPEGSRDEAMFCLWTMAAINTDDEVIDRADRYRVMTIWPRPQSGFTKALLGLIHE